MGKGKLGPNGWELPSDSDAAAPLATDGGRVRLSKKGKLALDALKEENDSLRDTIAKNGEAAMAREQELQETIDRLTLELKVAAEALTGGPGPDGVEGKDEGNSADEATTPAEATDD